MPRGPVRLKYKNRMNQSGYRISVRRIELGLTQSMLCGRIADLTSASWNPTEGDIGRIERGTRIVSDIELAILAKALESSIQHLLDI
jgi:hypothetical protein